MTVAITSKTEAWKNGWNDTIDVLLRCTKNISDKIKDMKDRIVIAKTHSLVSQIKWQYADGASDAIDTWESCKVPPDFVD